MIWAQISNGRKLHLAGQPGDEVRGEVVRTGFLSHPLCNQPMSGNYRMTCNVPLASGYNELTAKLRKAIEQATTAVSPDLGGDDRAAGVNHEGGE